jgi:ABC-type glycerol-3-phosphate transport system substrate-binding protein
MARDSNPDSVSRRNVIKGLGAGVGAASLAGCTGSVPGMGGSTPEVIYWTDYFGDENDDEWENWYKTSYEENNDAELTVAGFTYMDRRQKFLTGARQGKPDYIEGVLSHLSEFVKADLLEPITDKAQGLDRWDGYIDGAKDAMSFKGEIYGLPFTGNGRAFVYRKDIFDKHGLSAPKTAEDFLEAGRVIKENEDITPFHNCTKKGSVRGFQEWMSHVYQYHDALYVPDGENWKLQATPDTLGKIFKWFYYEPWAGDEPICDPEQKGTGWQVNDPDYLNGNTAMIECGPWIRGWTTGEEISNSDKTKTILDENTRIAHLPYAPGGERGTYLEVKPVMVNAHSEHKDLAFQGADLFTNLQSYEELRKAIPGTGELATPMHTETKSTLTDEDWQPFSEVIKTAKPLAKISWGPVRTAFYNQMQSVVYGEKDPMPAGKDLHSELKDLETEV